MPAEDKTPHIDASMGLIFRLNSLWTDAHRPAITGKYDEWNAYLDMIFFNLDYDVDYKVVKNSEEKIVAVKMAEEPKKIFDFLNMQIALAKKDCKNINQKEKPRSYSAARGRWYNSLVKKDRWLRKFMMSKKLYLKEVEYSPGTSLFG